MSWLKTLPVLGKLLLKGMELWERQQRAKQQKEREQKYEDIKNDSLGSHSQRFGGSSGRVRIDRTDNT
ncbi:hypothetical protein L3Q72_06640 [Vibrio sp. JC009]|uniref:hypothetical protein n=1 Tax=Vibrio sp. JC009 TaxID=2912314 RepID=UPI0023AFF0FE|nr:hypothetical protein [Vibrio sp. JC009]WED23065.1 hypothetical protein L3Q72_06640 [Vibrio sp. JC009]